MNEQPARRATGSRTNQSRWSSSVKVRAALWVVVAVAAALALVLLAHAPFVRSSALQYALETVQRDYGLTLQADRLDYNLATLRIGLAGLRVSAEGSLDEPFFEAE